MPTETKSIKNNYTSHNWQKGPASGSTFTFPVVGEGMALHAHEEGQAHFTFVRKHSRVRLHYGDGRPPQDLEPGDWKVIEPGEVHGYECLVSGSRITNVTY